MANTEVMQCPVCDWTYERTAIATAPPLLADIFGMGVESLTAMWVHQEAGATERALHNHLAKHTPEEWLPKLVTARQERDEARRTLAYVCEHGVDA